MYHLDQDMIRVLSLASKNYPIDHHYKMNVSKVFLKPRKTILKKKISDVITMENLHRRKLWVGPVRETLLLIFSEQDLCLKQASLYCI